MKILEGGRENKASIPTSKLYSLHFEVAPGVGILQATFSEGHKHPPLGGHSDLQITCRLELVMKYGG
jgi:hypothetical protein